MGLIDQIKNEVKQSGSNKGKIFYCKDGTKQRIRFLTDMEDGIAITFHDSFEKGINVPCREHFGSDCPYCEDEDLRTRQQYVWTIYNYETKETQLFMFPVNSFSPIPALMAMYDTYGTITDRDYVITRTGKGTSTSYSVVPMDKVKFRNSKVKAYSEKKILDIINKAYPDDEDEDIPKKSKSKTKTKVEDNDEWDDEEENSEYADMSAKELYKLCKERGIEAAPKKSEKYYVNLLEEDDEARDEWDDEEEDDDWEDEE